MSDSRFFRDDLRSYNDDNYATTTSTTQIAIEKTLREIFEKSAEKRKNHLDELHFLFQGSHLRFLENSLFELCRSYQILDSSRPWLVYWICHSIAVLGRQFILTKHAMKIAAYIKTCENAETGGYGGSPGSISHLVTTYAAINALVTLESTDALNTIDREKLYSFLKSMKCKDGSFRMHTDGERDARGAYCAISVASICNILDEELISGTPEWLATCQTYEGGFGPCPGMEAHSGYTFCAMASIAILTRFELVQFESLLKWLTKKQMAFEGGFCGRTNKLVDGCYSFWQSAVFDLTHFYYEKKVEQNLHGFLFDQKALQEYILLFCQAKNGGMRDKPGKTTDLYHSCYVLAGLSIAQRGPLVECVIGNSLNKLEPIDSRYNLTLSSLYNAKKFFKNKISTQ